MATQGGMSRGEQPIYGQMLTKHDRNAQIHVEQIQERHFLRIKKAKAKNISKGLGWVWGGISTGHLPLRGGKVSEDSREGDQN